jgi:hypothetical protein
MSHPWLIRAGKNGELVDEWLRNGILTVGWDVGDLSETTLGWDETKNRIVDEHHPNDPGHVTGRVRGFVGVRSDQSKNVKLDDEVIVMGDASVVGVAVAGEYQYEEDGLAQAPSHTYWRNIAEMQSAGPVELRNLPDRFRQGGRDSLQLGSTLQRYRPEREGSVEELASILGERST